jgi:hypothetical protein
VAITEAFAVSETVSTTEHSFTTDTAGPDLQTDDGVYQMFFDVSALASGDEFRFRVYEKVQSGDTQRIVYETTLVGPQSPPILVFPSLVLMHGWDVTVDKIAGTDRAITGSVRKVA